MNIKPSIVIGIMYKVFGGNIMIEIKNLTKSFGNVSVLKDINLTINKGEIDVYKRQG